MNKSLWGFALCLFVGLATGMRASAEPLKILPPDQLVVADFNSGDRPNNIGGDFGSWDKDPEDATQGCRVSFDPEDAVLPKGEGYSLRLRYDVDSPNEAYNGFWMKLEGNDFSQYNTLSFYVKGDSKEGFTDRIKIELKTVEKGAILMVGGIRGEWKKVSIPLKKFRNLKSFKSMSEFVVVFEDQMSVPKTGSILIDQITFSKEKQ
jgi:hypothetical protein